MAKPSAVSPYIQVDHLSRLLTPRHHCRDQVPIALLLLCMELLSDHRTRRINGGVTPTRQQITVSFYIVFDYLSTTILVDKY